MLFSFYLIIKLKRFKVLGVIPILFALNLGKGVYIQNPEASIFMPQMNIKQELKWEKDYQRVLHENNFEEIAKAIELKKRFSCFTWNCIYYSFK